MVVRLSMIMRPVVFSNSLPNLVLSTTSHYYRTRSFPFPVHAMLSVLVAKFESKVIIRGVISGEN